MCVLIEHYCSLFSSLFSKVPILYIRVKPLRYKYTSKITKFEPQRRRQEAEEKRFEYYYLSKMSISGGLYKVTHKKRGSEDPLLIKFVTLRLHHNVVNSEDTEIRVSPISTNSVNKDERIGNHAISCFEPNTRLEVILADGFDHSQRNIRTVEYTSVVRIRSAIPNTCEIDG